MGRAGSTWGRMPTFRRRIARLSPSSVPSPCSGSASLRGATSGGTHRALGSVARSGASPVACAGTALEGVALREVGDGDEIWCSLVGADGSRPPRGRLDAPGAGPTGALAVRPAGVSPGWLLAPRARSVLRLPRQCSGRLRLWCVMTCYVDALLDHPASLCRGLPGRRWCHLVSDESDEELHAFAARIGMRRSWAQLPPASSTPHYDLTPSRRARAVAAGAVEADRATFVAAIRRRRARNADLL